MNEPYVTTRDEALAAILESLVECGEFTIRENGDGFVRIELHSTLKVHYIEPTTLDHLRSLLQETS